MGPPWGAHGAPMGPPWVRGPMGPWAHGLMGPWAHGPMGPWAHGPMGPRSRTTQSHHEAHNILSKIIHSFDIFPYIPICPWLHFLYIPICPGLNPLYIPYMSMVIPSLLSTLCGLLDIYIYIYTKNKKTKKKQKKAHGPLGPWTQAHGPLRTSVLLFATWRSACIH